MTAVHQPLPYGDPAAALPVRFRLPYRHGQVHGAFHMAHVSALRIIPTRGRGCIGSRTLEWVLATAAHLPHVPSLAFIHIPVPQLVDVYNHFPTVGQKNEGVTCPEAADPGVFAALK